MCVRARTHTRTHARDWRAAPLSGAQRGSKAHCEPNLEPRDPAPPPPASQPARDVPEINDARESGQGLVP